MNSGVYKITNKINNEIYIGSAANGFKSRWQKHLSDLKLNKHCNSKLQNTYNKYGKDIFEFEILAKCPREYVIKLEQFFLDYFNPYYNISLIAGSSLGIKRTDEYKAKLSKSRTGYKTSDEFKEKCRSRMIGNSYTLGHKLSDEHKQKVSPIGRIHSTETKVKISKSNIGQKRSDELKLKVKQARLINIYQIINIKNGEVFITDNLKEFSIQNNLTEIGLHNSFNGKDSRGCNVNHHKGFKVLSKEKKSAA